MSVFSPGFLTSFLRLDKIVKEYRERSLVDQETYPGLFVGKRKYVAWFLVVFDNQRLFIGCSDPAFLELLLVSEGS